MRGPSFPVRAPNARPFAFHCHAAYAAGSVRGPAGCSGVAQGKASAQATSLATVSRLPRSAPPLQREPMSPVSLCPSLTPPIFPIHGRLTPMHWPTLGALAAMPMQARMPSRQGHNSLQIRQSMGCGFDALALLQAGIWPPGVLMLGSRANKIVQPAVSTADCRCHRLCQGVFPGARQVWWLCQPNSHAGQAADAASCGPRHLLISASAQLLYDCKQGRAPLSFLGH